MMGLSDMKRAWASRSRSYVVFGEKLKFAHQFYCTTSALINICVLG